MAVPNRVALDEIAVGTYSFYSTDEIKSPYITNTIDLGFAYIYECASSDAEKIRRLFKRIDGESISFDTAISTRKILDMLNARVVSTDNTHGMEMVCAHNPRQRNYIVEGGRKINLQIAKSKDKTTIGIPVILGSY